MGAYDKTVKMLSKFCLMLLSASTLNKIVDCAHVVLQFSFFKKISYNVLFYNYLFEIFCKSYLKSRKTF